MLDEFYKGIKKYKKKPNKVSCVKQVLREICKDQDELMQIKAEAQEDDYIATTSCLMSICTLIITICGALYETASIEAIIVCWLIILAFNFRFRYTVKWRKYILVVVDDLIEESKKNEQVYEIEVEEIASHKKSTYIGKIQRI